MSTLLTSPGITCLAGYPREVEQPCRGPLSESRRPSDPDESGHHQSARRQTASVQSGSLSPSVEAVPLEYFLRVEPDLRRRRVSRAAADFLRVQPVWERPSSVACRNLPRVENPEQCKTKRPRSQPERQCPGAPASRSRAWSFHYSQFILTRALFAERMRRSIGLFSFNGPMKERLARVSSIVLQDTFPLTVPAC